MKKLLIKILLGVLLVTCVSWRVTWDVQTAQAAALELFSTTLFSDANLQSYWRLENNSNDAKGSNNGTDTNVTYGAAQFNTGWIGNGTTGRTALGTGLSETGAMTIMGWVNITDYTVYNLMLTKRDEAAGAPNTQYEFYTQITSGKLSFYNGTSEFPSSGAALGTGGWHFIAMTLSANPGNLKFYVDGSQNGTTQASISLGAGGSTLKATLGGVGGATNSNSEWFKGTMDDVAIFNRELSATEISNHFNGTDGLATIKPSLLNFD